MRIRSFTTLGGLVMILVLAAQATSCHTQPSRAERISSGSVHEEARLDVSTNNAAEDLPIRLLQTRHYHIGTNTFELMRKSLSESNQLPSIHVLWAYLKANGVDLSSQDPWFYSYGKQTLMVRSTKENLDGIECLLTELK
jgi:hypothetical protein